MTLAPGEIWWVKNVQGFRSVKTRPVLVLRSGKSGKVMTLGISTEFRLLLKGTDIVLDPLNPAHGSLSLPKKSFIAVEWLHTIHDPASEVQSFAGNVSAAVLQKALDCVLGK